MGNREREVTTRAEPELVASMARRLRNGLRMNPRALASTLFTALAACGTGDLGAFTDAGPDLPAEPQRSYRFTLDDATPGALPSDFIRVLGTWSVVEDSSAPSPRNVIRQTAQLAGADFPRVLIKGLTFSDVTLKVRCRPESGDEDQACGLIFRAVDSNNYYLTRANALEDNVRLYHVIDGNRSQIAGGRCPNRC
jgi:hypothetical protein